MLFLVWSIQPKPQVAGVGRGFLLERVYALLSWPYWEQASGEKMKRQIMEAEYRERTLLSARFFSTIDG